MNKEKCGKCLGEGYYETYGECRCYKPEDDDAPKVASIMEERAKRLPMLAPQAKDAMELFQAFVNQSVFMGITEATASIPVDGKSYRVSIEEDSQ